MKSYLKLLRINHYIKNLLIFIPIACSGEMFDLEKMKSGIIGFIVFCATSSLIYILNDIMDCEKDRMHPTKCKRPIASGEVKKKNALLLMAVLLVIVVVLSSLIYSPLSVALLAIYVVLNIGYSLGLKDVPIVDVAILVSGFIIRVLYGADITGIVVSDWLYLTVMSVSFYFALGKRRNEVKYISKGDTRAVLKYYSESFLDKLMYVCLGLANAFYALWAMDKENSTRHVLWTVPVVLLISMAYSMCIEKDSTGDPVDTFLHNKALLILCIIYLVIMGILLY